MKIWCISDSHNMHKKLTIPENIDMVIHAGDASSTKDASFNEAEMREFLTWYDTLAIKHKIYIPGNHDTSVEKGMFNYDNYPNIHILIHESITIEGINIFGSPYTPQFGMGWAYNMKQTKMQNAWKNIPANTDILVTHGPAKGVLDYTLNTSNNYVQCGCKALLNNVKEVSPQYHIFGHIHNESNVLNAGIFKPNGYDTCFVNASVVDLRHNVVNNGITIGIENGKNNNTCFEDLE